MSIDATAHVSHSELAGAIRALSMDAVEKAKSGHAGLPLGAADIATVLWTRFLKFDAADLSWPDRDRFVLSAGHGSMLLYSLLYLAGVKEVTVDELKRFRQLDSKTPGHPEHFMTPGIETTTGPLGQGLATAVGMALAERMLNAEYGTDIVDHHTYVLCSDGDLMEGVSQEAIALAGHLKLSRLIVLFDDNGISIDGPLTLADSVDQPQRFESAGWRSERIDGHDPDAIAAAITRAQSSDRPSMIACKTIIGYGAPHKAGTSKAHSDALGPEELAGAKKAIGWTAEPFVIPEPILSAWREFGRRGAPERDGWLKRLDAMAEPGKAELARRMKNEMPKGFGAAIQSVKAAFLAKPEPVASRKSGETTLETIVPMMPELVVGSADLTPSNNVKTKTDVEVSPGHFAGNYVHYGIREHGMSAALNGLTVHGGLRGVGSSFLTFSDYARPAIRIAALSGIPAIWVFTHDSIGLGEDGPTHQPVEHLAALRAMPNLLVLRPGDAIETAECWQLAIERTDGPSLLALSRQSLRLFRTDATDENRCAHGAYEVLAAPNAVATLFASGSEVDLALDAAKLLGERGIPARVVSVPSLDLFLSQPQEVRDRIVGTAPIRLAVEAAVRFGWDAVIGDHGLFVGMAGFGASAPAKDLFPHFGITAEAVADRVARAHNRQGG